MKRRILRISSIAFLFAVLMLSVHPALGILTVVPPTIETFSASPGAEVERTITTDTYNDLHLEDSSCNPGGNHQIGRWASIYKHAAFRFQNITIPQGTEITAAYLKVYKTAIGASGSTTTRIYARDVDNPSLPGNCDWISDTGSFTTAYTEFSVADADWTPLDAWYQTPDFTAVIQEIINRDGWSSGNAMFIIWRCQALVGCYTFRGYPNGNEAILHIEYDTSVERQITDSTYNDVEASGTPVGAACAPGGNPQIGRDNVMDFWVGLRFQDITIPQGNTITNAYLKVYKTHIDWAGTCTTRIYLYDADDVDEPTNCDLVTDTGNFTTEYKEFNVSDADWTPLNAWYQTPDFKNAVQEVINRGGWSSGNDMYVIWRRVALAGNKGFSGYGNGNEATLFIEHQETGVIAPTVETKTATDVQETTATLVGDITSTGGGNADERGFEWDTDSGTPYTSNWTESGNYTAGQFTHGISGLSENETYYYRAIAHNSAGWGYGSEFTFIPGFAVTTLPATSVETTSATLQGSLTDDGGESCSLRFVYGLTTYYGSTTPWESGYTTGASYSKTITGLSADTQYHFRIEAKHADENTVYGADTLFNTIPLGAPSVTTISATEVTSSSAKLQGAIDSLGDHSTVYVYFEYGQTVGYGTTTVEQTKTATGGFNQVVSGLSSGTTYHYRAVVRYNGNYVYGSDKSFIATEAGEPGVDPPDILRIDDVKVFTNYLSTGDQLYVISYRIVYTAGTPILDCSDYFDFQLLDGTTLKAQTPVKSWDYKPGSVYLISSSAPIWGGEYRVKIIGTPEKWETPPECYRDLTSGDWQGSDLVQLDTWVISLAESLQSYYNSEMVVYTVGGTPVLSTQGGVVFNMGIPGLSTVRPHLFKARVEYAEYDKPVREDKLQPLLDPRERLGPYVTNILEEGGALVGQDLNATVGWIFGSLYICSAVIIGVFTGMWIVAFAVVAPLVLAGMWVGGIPVAGLMLVASLLVLFILKAIWLKGI